MWVNLGFSDVFYNVFEGGETIPNADSYVVNAVDRDINKIEVAEIDTI